MEIVNITNQNIEKLRNVYSEFRKVAVEDYLFEVYPIPFDDFKENFSSGFLQGYYLKDEENEAFLIYTDSLNKAVEITLIYTKEQEEDYKIKTAILEKFIENAKTKYKGKTISYPMLGVQNNFVQDITHLGFELVGEMIVEIDFSSPVSLTILDKCDTPEVQAPYSLDCWKDCYLESVSQVIYDEFSKLNDTKFDPRFTIKEETKQIIKEITNGYYGKFDPKYTTVLLENGIPIGCCFVNFTTDELANIPLIAVSNKYSQKGYGAKILKNSVNLVKNYEPKIKKLNATCDTENFSAIKAYRKVGFKENLYYSHAYLNI